MPTLTRYFPQSESELHLIMQKEMDALEKGLQIIQHEYATTSGSVDFLCIDSGGRLVIIEVKLHEDESALFQALRYFSTIDRDRYLIASSLKGKMHVSPDDSPRIVLVAERFSDDLRRLSTLVEPDVELFEYSTVLLPDGAKGILFHPVSLPVPSQLPTGPKSIEELISYMTEVSLRPIIEKARSELCGLGKGVEGYPTQDYTGYKHACGRQFAYIRVFRRSFEIGAHIIDENKALIDYQGTRVEKGDEDYSDVMQRARVRMPIWNANSPH